ncbi:MAG: M4 family metallopeptidase [Pseudomonadota bacterium]|nr:M4 family metallopeptidase [Pseudomonadota bacterium]
MHINRSGLRLATTVLLSFISITSFAVSWEPVTKDAFTSLPLQSARGIALSETKREMVAMALQLGVNESLLPLAQGRDKAGNLHSRYQQTYQDLPVWGQHITLHERSGQVYGAGGRVARGLATSLSQRTGGSPAGVNPDQSAYEKVALQWVATKTGLPADQWTLSQVDVSRQVYLAEQRAVIVRVTTFLARHPEREPVRPVALIQEDTLDILQAWDRLAHTEATGPGGNVKVGRYEYGTDYGFLEVTETATGCALINDNVYTVDLQHGSDDNLTTPFEFPCYENAHKEINGAYSPLNDAHYFGNVVFNLYQDWYNLAPLPFQLALKVHYRDNYDNAYWDGQSMVFGDGGSRFYPLVDINVVSHEVSHGFTEQNSNLIYNQQSGGINEAFSDMAGEAAEYYLTGSVDWLNGAAITKNTTALRYFADPTEDGLSIGHASDFYTGMDVHHSSGVFNRAYYLIATAEGWNPRTAFDLFVQANRFHWVPTTGFEEGACGVLSAAGDLGYPKFAVMRAFVTVGIYCRSDNLDTDADGMPDGWEYHWGFDPTDPSDALGDLDTDGVNNVTEFQYQTDPTLSDTDHDSLGDYDEIQVHGTSPILPDTDSDQMPDGFEVQYRLDPLDPADAALDFDGDGSPNLEEYQLGTDPTDPTDFVTPMDFYLESFETPLDARWQQTSDSSSGGWAQSTDWSSHGQHSYVARGLTHSQRASLTLAGVFEAGTLTFDYRVSTEACCDRLLVFLDGNQVLSRSGSANARFSLALAPGPHTIVFQYRKDGSVDAGLDSVWIDALLFETDDPDVDNDGLPNHWEVQYGLNPEDPADASLDQDGDGASNLQEFEYGSNPTLTHSDADNLNDGVEINQYGTSPVQADTDGDEMDDGFEVAMGLDPLDPADAAQDLDGDGYTNLEEFRLGTDPTDPDDFLEPIALMFESFETELPADWEISSSNSSGAGWGINSGWSTHGSQSFAASGLADNQSATLRFTLFVTDGTLSFDYRTATETCCDRLYVYVDGSQVMNASGIRNGRFSLDLTAGLHSFEFTYHKDGSIRHDQDTVWIDALLFESDTDVDADGLPNQWEIQYGLDLLDPTDAALDQDGDGASNRQEFEYGTDPTLEDSDGDTLSDGDEINVHGSNPGLRDSDGDQMEDGFEVLYGLNPTDPADAELDLDGDGSSNLEECQRGSDPSDPADFVPSIEYMALTFEADSLPAGWSITTSGSGQWDFSDDWSSQGNRSLKASGLQNGTVTALQFHGWTRGGTLRMDLRTRFLASGRDRLLVYLNGEARYAFSSFTDQTTRLQVPLAAGEHRIEIQLQRNSAADDASSAWIDLVWFESANTDLDADGLPNEWELAFDLDPQEPHDAEVDTDLDGLSNLEEFQYQGNPRRADSDDDGADDTAERSANTGLDNPDSDGDEMHDGFEIRYGLDPLDGSDAALDSDGDRLTNLDEFRLQLDPTDPASMTNPLLLWQDSFESGPAPQWRFSTQQAQPWTTSASWSSHGGFSLAQENMAFYSTATAEFTALFQAGTLQYDFNLQSSSLNSRLRLYVNGVLEAEHHDYDAPGSFLLNLTAGVHNLRFEMDNPYSGGPTHLYLDNLRFFTSSEEDDDGDGIPSTWEAEHGLDPTDPADGQGDPDADGLSNLQEYEGDTDPLIANVDLQVTMTKLFETRNDEVNYRVRVTNIGQVDAHNLVILHSSASNFYLTYIAEENSTVDCISIRSRLDCTLPSLPVGEERVMDIVMGVPNASDKHLVVSSAFADEVDYQPENNEARGEYAGSLSWWLLTLLSGLYWAKLNWVKLNGARHFAGKGPGR